jgi:hypothetical protein
VGFNSNAGAIHRVTTSREVRSYDESEVANELRHALKSPASRGKRWTLNNSIALTLITSSSVSPGMKYVVPGHALVAWDLEQLSQMTFALVFSFFFFFFFFFFLLSSDSSSS